MRLYILIGIIPLGSFLMSHMIFQRRRVLHAKRKRD